MIAAISPALGLVVLGTLVLVFDLVWQDKDRANLGWLTAGGLFVVILITVFVSPPPSESTLLWGGMIHHDWLGVIFQLIFMFGAAVTALIVMEYDYGQKGEFYLLLLTSTLGMSLVSSAGDLIMLYLAFETTSIPLYIMAGFLKEDKKSVEAGFKYLLFGAASSAVMLFGFSLVFGFSGETNLLDITQAVRGGSLSLAAVALSLVMILVGFSFKIAAFPFHFWAPDVYQGAPTPVSGFLSTASKAAGFSVLLRVLFLAFPEVQSGWQLALAVISACSMTIGNVIALTQKDVKRLLAYSSIAHAGYILIGVSSASPLGVGSAVFYLGVYLITNLAAFGAVAVVGEKEGTFTIDTFDGLSKRAPALALGILVSFLSLAGMPPFGGFIAKVLVFAAAVEADLIWLVVIGVLNTIGGLYYYLIVLKHIYLYQSERDKVPFQISIPASMVLVLLSVGILLIGTVFTPWYNWAMVAAELLF